MAEQQSIDETVGPIGGQALLEGVMMRRGGSWGAAVRRLDGTIATTSRTLPEGLDGWRKLPLVRGVVALGETAALGTKATLWAARERGDEKGDGYSTGGLALTVAIALVAVFGVFGLFPAVVVKAAGVTDPLLFSVVEGLIRLAILVGYLSLLGRSPQVKRVFAYHGAEHMTIHAYEAHAPITVDGVRPFPKEHQRCGTSFLLVVVVVAMLTFFAFDVAVDRGILVRTASRIVFIPVVAGVAYEILRLGARFGGNAFVHAMFVPNIALQALTTKVPDDSQIEVAIASFEATLEAAGMVTAKELARDAAALEAAPPLD